MRLKNSGFQTMVLILSITSTWAAAATVHHDLEVRIQPDQNSLQVVNRVSFLDAVTPDENGAYRFVLHAGLEPKVATPGWRLQLQDGPAEAGFLGINATTETVSENVPLDAYVLIPEGESPGPVELVYGGVIHHELATQGEEYQRSFSETPGIIDDRGVFLAGASFWVPTFGDGLMTFDLVVGGLTPPWDVVSQGRRTHHEVDSEGFRSTSWSLGHPTEEIYLIAGPWHEYSREAGDVEVFAFLRDDDPALAQRYLDATARYLDLYQGMLPPFPFASFALVENFWETGYGMPGFTLLGPQVIRFPWILTSSYPHELLHNWWGNSIYVEFEHGNWCEGLTAYMADHLFAEQRGEGATYRRATLKKYTDMVSAGEDFPLAEFGSRQSAASEAVGYGKSLMLFHMARRAVGNEAFLAALSLFDREHRFSRASFSDIAEAFTDETGGDWAPFIEEWVERTGAPRFEIREARVEEGAPGEAPWRVAVHLRQVQDEEPFPVTVPVAVTIEGQEEPVWAEAGACARDCIVEVACSARPLRVDVDPAFDVMRRLDPLEVPPALSTVFGAKEQLFVLPASASDEETAAWRELAADWARPEKPNIVLDSELSVLPDTPTWVLGWDNRFGSEIAGRLADQGISMRGASVALAGDVLPKHDHSMVVVARAKGDPTAAVSWVTAAPTEAIPGLARKLPHYTRYSYLGFRGPEPENMAKGMWQPLSSPLVRNLSDGDMPNLELPARVPLAELPPAYDAQSLKRTVAELADPALEGRGLGSEGLHRATALVEARLGAAGLEPAAENGIRQSWRWTGGEPAREMELVNLVARVPGRDPKFTNEPVLVIAHLDHLGRGWPDSREGNENQVHPGADDNASGVAVLLELARAMASEPPRPRPVVFAIVTGEEAGLLGSRHLLASMTPDEKPFACVNLDTVGRLADGKLYVLNADTAREWRFIFMGVGYTTGAPVTVVSEPLDASDQVACIEMGVPAIQLFTGPTPDYHRPSDTVDTIDADGMVVVTEAAHEAIGYLAERTEPLTVTIAAAANDGDGPPPRTSRRASLGTMPDFAFEGPGVRVQQVMPGSAAEESGIIAGDVILAIDGATVTDLRSFSDLLKARAPGDAVEVTVLRGDEEQIVEAVLGAR
ncbi:MAG: M20/M25/M40 family metallo-hydrolase [Acidobacteria bacterium]|nr:M20/M25/M40 family metallo-hydrolase [Candidatus Sulfomarinibacter kjeldsenii]